MNITKEELDLLRKACRGGNGDVADYLKYTGKDSICYADEIMRLANAYEEANWSLAAALEAVKQPMKRVVAALSYVVQRCGRSEAKLCGKTCKCRDFVPLDSTRKDSGAIAPELPVLRAAFEAADDLLRGDKTTRVMKYLGMRCAAYEQKMCFKCSEPHNVLCGLAGQLTAARRNLGDNASPDEYIEFFAKKLADEHYILHLKYGCILDAECSPEGQVQKAIKAVEAGHDGPEYISAR